MEDKPKIKWASCKLGLEEGTNKIKLSCDNKDDFAFINGLLIRISVEAAKELLLDEAHKQEEKNNESKNVGE